MPLCAVHACLHVLFMCRSMCVEVADQHQESSSITLTPIH